jgi:hypothetical protein
MSQADLCQVTDQLIYQTLQEQNIPCYEASANLCSTRLVWQCFRQDLSISFQHQIALVAHACEKLYLTESNVRSAGQESQNGRLLLRAEMDHVGPAVRKRNRQIFIVGYRINRVGLRALACWHCWFESREWHGCLPLLIVVSC